VGAVSLICRVTSWSLICSRSRDLSVFVPVGSSYWQQELQCKAPSNAKVMNACLSPVHLDLHHVGIGDFKFPVLKGQ
jgi:hypothetical protein